VSIRLTCGSDSTHYRDYTEEFFTAGQTVDSSWVTQTQGFTTPQAGKLECAPHPAFGSPTGTDPEGYG
jgi:hypothetical protein